ncbi:hypothetical protein ACE0DR_28035 [Azotobacter sp. CWF10]
MEGYGDAASPSALVASIGTALTSMLLEKDDNIEEQQRTLSESLVAEIEERLARQVAARWGAEYVQQVEEFTSRMQRFR